MVPSPVRAVSIRACSWEASTSTQLGMPAISVMSRFQVRSMIASIFAAAMSASSGELSALSSATIIDFYKRHFVQDADDAHYLRASKVSTAAWGLFSCVVAMYAANQGSLIEVVNRYGSFFYGSILGVFILALLTKRATATGAFVGLIAGMAVVLSVAFGLPWVAFLWHDLIGAVVVVAVGMAVSMLSR